jgi:hypothetical protein
MVRYIKRQYAKISALFVRRDGIFSSHLNLNSGRANAYLTNILEILFNTNLHFASHILCVCIDQKQVLNKISTINLRSTL